MDIIICDIGYSSNDIALYNVSSLNPLKLREKPRQQPTSEAITSNFRGPVNLPILSLGDIDPDLPEANIILGVIEDDSSWPDLYGFWNHLVSDTDVTTLQGRQFAYPH